MTVEAKARTPWWSPTTKEVRSSSPDFLVTALRTLPEELQPHYFDAVVQAQDGFGPAKNGVIAYTTLNLEWMRVGYQESGRFLPTLRNPFIIHEIALAGRDKLTGLKSSILLGGKPNEVRFHAVPLEHFTNRAFAYKAFIGEELERLLRDDFYHVHSADLASPLPRIIFGHDEKMTGFVRVSSVIDLLQKKVVALNQWFANLAKI